jgi:UDP-N-acetylenolpyruvoylglucosamine reductase
MDLTVRLREEKINQRTDYPLRNLSSLGCGGNADYFFEPKNTVELETIIRIANEYSIPFTILGDGTNVLISDKGIRGFVISMKSFLGITIKGDLVTALAGENLDRLINRAIEHNLTGLEELGGIPGTIGGAVKGNAGANDKWISNYFFYADYLQKDGILRRKAFHDDDFAYRKSPFSDTDIILSCAFRLVPNKDSASARLRKDRFRAAKIKKGQFLSPSAGCFFKNPEGMSAGALIDKAGLKGRTLGGAVISPFHANFIVNPERKASAKELYDLSQIAIEEVHKQFGVKLEYEIRLLGEF